MTARTYVIGEAGVNHDGSLARALELVDIAADAGVDAVKFQTFRAESLASAAAPKCDYQIASTGVEESQLAMLRRLELDEQGHRALAARCAVRGIEFLSTPFEPAAVRFLVEEVGVRRLKLPSGEITNPLLLLAVARAGLPIILSTGMATLGEVEDALAVLAFGLLAAPGERPDRRRLRAAYASVEGQRALAERVTLLHCTTEYPAPLSEVNLRVLDTLRAAFGLPVGYSDHTEGTLVPLAAVARGAVVVEKHFTVDRALPGPDHRASLEPAELRAMVTAIRQVEQALGEAHKAPTASEGRNREVARRSLVARRAIRRGEPLSEEALALKRPGTGVSPMEIWDLLGRTASRDYRPDEPIER